MWRGDPRWNASPPSRRPRGACPGTRRTIRFDVTPRGRDPARMHDETTEPRVPGGPLAIGGLHPLSWVFILLALADLVWFIVNANTAAMTSLADVVFYGI